MSHPISHIDDDEMVERVETDHFVGVGVGRVSRYVLLVYTDGDKKVETETWEGGGG